MAERVRRPPPQKAAHSLNSHTTSELLPGFVPGAAGYTALNRNSWSEQKLQWRRQKRRLDHVTSAEL